MSETRLEQALDSIRARRGKIDALINAWKPPLRKTDLARALVPTIEEKTRAAIAGTGEPPQLARALDDAYHLANSQPHGLLALRSVS